MAISPPEKPSQPRQPRQPQQQTPAAPDVDGSDTRRQLMSLFANKGHAAALQRAGVARSREHQAYLKMSPALKAAWCQAVVDAGADANDLPPGLLPSDWLARESLVSLPPWAGDVEQAQSSFADELVVAENERRADEQQRQRREERLHLVRAVEAWQQRARQRALRVDERLAAQRAEDDLKAFDSKVSVAGWESRLGR